MGMKLCASLFLLFPTQKKRKKDRIAHLALSIDRRKKERELFNHYSQHFKVSKEYPVRAEVKVCPSQAREM